MTAVIILVRHGTHEGDPGVLWGRMPGPPLSAEGRAEAARAAARLAGERVAAIQASPVERTRETAGIIAETLGLPVQEAPELLEIDFGRWAGQSFRRLQEDPAWRTWNADRGRAATAGGETMLAVQLRVAGWLRAMRDRHDGAAVVGVSHGDVLRAAIAFVLGLPLGFYDRLEVTPGSLTTIVAGEWGFKLQAMNEMPR